jgi:putative hydrolase of the HAD superfamily
MDQERFGALLAEGITCDPEFLRAVESLSHSMKLGIVSNGGSSTQRRKWRAAGLSEIIPHDRVIISGEVGMAKPECGIFLLASEILGVSPEDCLHLGDHRVNDLDGARAAGMRAHLVESVLSAESLKRHLHEESHVWIK